MNADYVQSLHYFTKSWWPYAISFVISLILAIRLYMAGPKCPSTNRIDGKIVLITGPTSGVGYELAKALTQRGGIIILACRNEEKGKIVLKQLQQDSENAKLDLRVLDISKLDNINKFAKKLTKTYDRLDILINNAGIINQQHQVNEENIDLMLLTNYIGPFFLTHLLLPLLKKSDNGRIINLTASAHSTATLNTNDLINWHSSRFLFGQTKLAIVLFTKHLAHILTDSNITINAVNPGLLRDTNHLKSLELDKTFFGKISVWPWKWLFLKTAKEGCQSVLYAAVDPNLTHVTGQYISDCEIKSPGDITNHGDLLKDVYEVTCSLLNLDINYARKQMEDEKIKM